jgi:hypothetical protein
MFTGLLSLRLTDFTDAIELNAGRLDKIQVEVFSNFLCDSAINGTSFAHSTPFVCDTRLSSGSLTKNRMSPASAISGDVGRGFLCLAKHEHVYPTDPYRREDRHWNPPLRCQSMLAADLLALDGQSQPCEVSCRERRIGAPDLLRQACIRSRVCSPRMHNRLSSPSASRHSQLSQPSLRGRQVLC